MRHEKDGEKQERGGERVCVLGDSLGLLQKRRRLTACDDWRLSVEKNKGRDKIQRERKSTWVT